MFRIRSQSNAQPLINEDPIGIEPAFLIDRSRASDPCLEASHSELRIHSVSRSFFDSLLQRFEVNKTSHDESEISHTRRMKRLLESKNSMDRASASAVLDSLFKGKNPLQDSLITIPYYKTVEKFLLFSTSTKDLSSRTRFLSDLIFHQDNFVCCCFVKKSSRLFEYPDYLYEGIRNYDDEHAFQVFKEAIALIKLSSSTTSSLLDPAS